MSKRIIAEKIVEKLNNKELKKYAIIGLADCFNMEYLINKYEEILTEKE